MSNNSNESKPSIHPAAYFFVASNGGVVGTDYATWMNVDPVIGAIIGGIISLVILGNTSNMIAERETIKENFMGLGALVGFILGSVTAHESSQESPACLIGAL